MNGQCVTCQRTVEVDPRTLDVLASRLYPSREPPSEYELVLPDVLDVSCSPACYLAWRETRIAKGQCEFDEMQIAVEDLRRFNKLPSPLQLKYLAASGYGDQWHAFYSEWHRSKAAKGRDDGGRR